MANLANFLHLEKMVLANIVLAPLDALLGVLAHGGTIPLAVVHAILILNEFSLGHALLRHGAFAPDARFRLLDELTAVWNHLLSASEVVYLNGTCAVGDVLDLQLRGVDRHHA